MTWFQTRRHRPGCLRSVALSMVLGGAIALLLTPVVLAEEDAASLGKSEYLENCAVCHGAGGKGDGVLAKYLKNGVPDLTGLAAANGGVFPVSRVYAIIDGTKVSGEHGTRDMPAWGMTYSLQAEGEIRRFSLGYRDSSEAFVRGRILALIEHLASLQE